MAKSRGIARDERDGKTLGKAGKWMSGCWCIARERSDSAYIRDKDRDRKTEAVGIGDK